MATVAHARPPVMDVRRGDLFWATPPDEDGAPARHPHPRVVIQDDALNASRLRTVVICALSSNLGRANEPGNVLLDDGEGGLAKRSVIVVSQVTSINKTTLGERIGALSQERVDAVLAGLRFQQRAFLRGR